MRAVRLGMARRCASAVALIALAFGCDSGDADGDGGVDPEAGAAGELAVDIGVPGGMDGLDFVEFESGGEIELETFGQGGTHVTVAVRARGIGMNRAYLDVTLLDLDSDARSMTPPTSRPQLWYCMDMKSFAECQQTRVFAPLGGLARGKDSLRVRITAVVTTLDGRLGSGSTEARLQRPPGLNEFDAATAGDAAIDAAAVEDDAGAP
jgi:hypothetical protein